MNSEDFKHIKEWNTKGPSLREKAVGGSKGCFPAGTLVSTPLGNLPIENLKEGDEVFCFDVDGTIHTSTVNSTSKHEDHPVVRIKHWMGVIYTTFNHWFLREDNTFQRVGDFSDNDALVSDSGTILPIESINTVSDNNTVYNITVNKYKTFIANGIRVHNGGDNGESFELSSKDIPTMGSGGGGKGGGGGGRPAVEDPDDLFSKASARVLDLIAEGEIEGLVDGAKSIYLNETVIQNSDSTYNFENVSWDQRTGTQAQDYIPGFSSVETATSVGVEIKKGSPGPVIRAITNPNLDALSVTLFTPSLTRQDKSTGDMHGSSVSYIIYIKYDNGSFVERVTSTINGKTTKKYERQHRINLSGDFTTVYIKVERITDDAADLSIQNALYWQSYTQIVDNKFTYPNSALIGVQIDAKQFSRIPNRAYDIKGTKVRVPSNYNSVENPSVNNNLYSGSWDGTFKTAWSNNPAWCYYDVLTDSRYGLGDYIPENHIDKWALYQIARYCDAVNSSGNFIGVDDGFGSKEKRFTLNLFLQTQNEAMKLITDIASVFRGMTYWGQGMLTAVQDSPKDPIMLFSEANVVGGEFTYSGTAKKARHTTALITWNNPEDFYRRNVEYVEDRDGISKWGVRQTDIVAFGCTSRAQAHRIGKWILYSERLETDTISFKTGIEGASLRPGDLIKIADPGRSGKRMGGRILAGSCSNSNYTSESSCVAAGETWTSTSNTKIYLDYPVLLDSNNTYNFSTIHTNPACIIEGEINSNYSSEVDCINASGQWTDYTFVDTKSVTNISSGSHNFIELSEAFEDIPNTQFLWVLDELGQAESQDFRVLAITESNKNEYTVTALEYNNTKFDHIENDLSLQNKRINSLPNPSSSVPSIINLSIGEELFLNPNRSVNNRMLISWEAPTVNGGVYPYIKQYYAEYKETNSSWKSLGNTQSPYIEVDNIPAGTYSVRVKLENILGKFSNWSPKTSVLLGKTAAPGNVATATFTATTIP